MDNYVNNIKEESQNNMPQGMPPNMSAQNARGMPQGMPQGMPSNMSAQNARGMPPQGIPGMPPGGPPLHLLQSEWMFYGISAAMCWNIYNKYFKKNYKTDNIDHGCPVQDLELEFKSK